jgi:arylsulfatase A-like enzyme
MQSATEPPRHSGRDRQGGRDHRGLAGAAPAPTRQRIERALVTAAAAAWALLPPLVWAKLSCVVAVSASALGERQLARESGMLATCAWLWPDLVAALVLGLFIGLWRFAQPPLSRRLFAIGLAGLQLLVAAALVVSVEVYELFGSPPTWQLLGALSDARNTTDSVREFLGWGPLLRFAAFALIGWGGALVLERALAARSQLARSAALGLLITGGALAAAASQAPASHFELDRNPLVAFVGSALRGRATTHGATPGGAYAEALAPVAGARPAKVDLGGYKLLRRWARQPPSIVFVVLESTAVREMQLTGGPVPNTPTLVRLSGRSVFWTSHYTHTPNSMHALYQLLGGNHTAPGGEPITETRPRIDCRSLSELLVGYGYRAGLFHSGRFSSFRKERFFVDRGYEVLHDAASMPGRSQHEQGSWGIREEPTVDALLAWIRGLGPGQPFFATYIPVHPHHPYKTPPGIPTAFPGEIAVERYRNAVHYVDQMVARLVAGLERLGVGDRTLVVIVGDHGEGFGEHPGNRTHGSKLYQEQVRSFVLWYAPGALERGHVDDRLFGHVDVMPTLLDLLGAEKPEQHPGVSALSGARRPMIPLYTGHGRPLAGLVDGRWKFILNRESDVSELYDLQDDPDETQSLVTERPELDAAYRQRVSAFTGAQLAWDRRLGDLRQGAAPRPRGRLYSWVVQPRSCEFPAEHFAVQDGQLHMTRGGEVLVKCRHPLPPGDGAVTHLAVSGVEGLNAAHIGASVVWEAGDGRRQEVAYCEMNGHKDGVASRCEAEIVLQRAGVRGGELVLWLRYQTKDPAPPFELFAVHEVEVRYRAAGGEAPSAPVPER